MSRDHPAAPGARSGQGEAYRALLKCGAFGRREAIEQGGDGSPGLVDCSGVGFAQEGFHFGEGLFDRVEVGRVGGQEEELGFGGADRGAKGAALVAAEVVHDDNVARREDRDENLLDCPREGGGLVDEDQSPSDRLRWSGLRSRSDVAGDWGHRLPA